MPDGQDWPKVSIVTPSYNQGRFLEETIRSVLLQSYPNLEYVIIDGGSTDDSADIIRKYARWVTYCVSEPDRGQSHAINKGFGHTSGSVLGWLNSDDLLLSDSLRRVVGAFVETDCEIVSGHATFVDEQSRFVGRYKAQESSVAELLRRRRNAAPQPSTFWSRRCWDRCGPLSEKLDYVMDYLYSLRMAASGYQWHIIPIDLAAHRRHSEQKTSTVHHCNLEIRTAIRMFKDSDLFTDVHAHLARRSLHYEGWLAYWSALHHVGKKRRPYILHWMLAPIMNWRCLVLTDFYVKSAKKFLGSLRSLLVTALRPIRRRLPRE